MKIDVVATAFGLATKIYMVMGSVKNMRNINPVTIIVQSGMR